MNDTSWAVFLMISTGHAIRAESVLKQAGVACKLISVPRHLSSDCGVCVRVAARDVEQTLCILKQAGLTFELHML